MAYPRAREPKAKPALIMSETKLRGIGDANIKGKRKLQVGQTEEGSMSQKVRLLLRGIRSLWTISVLEMGV